MNQAILASVFVRLELVVPVLLFLAVWVGVYGIIGKGPFNMDPQDALKNTNDENAWRLQGKTFEPILARYFGIAKLIISLAVGSIALLSGYIGYLVQNRDYGSLKIAQGVMSWPMFWLAFSVLYLLLMLVFLSTSYETYLHSQYRDTYSRCRYSFNLALGFSGLICFSLGYLWLVCSVVSLSLGALS